MKPKQLLLLAILPAALILLLVLKGISPEESSAPPAKETPQPAISQSTALPEEKFALKILYAGLADTDRAKDFMDFLDDHFEQVIFTDYNRFSEKAVKDYDVVILDHDGTETQAPVPTISDIYSRATVTMGVPGADICSRLSLKTGYL